MEKLKKRESRVAPSSSIFFYLEQWQTKTSARNIIHFGLIPFVNFYNSPIVGEVICFVSSIKKTRRKESDKEVKRHSIFLIYYDYVMKFCKEQIRSATVCVDTVPIHRRLKVAYNQSHHEATY